MASLLIMSLSLAAGCVDSDETFAEGCMSDSHDDAADGDAETGEDGDGGTGDGDDTGDGDGDDTGGGNGLTGCAAHETVAGCMAQLGCAPVFGQPLIEDGSGGYCSDQVDLYLGCISTLGLCPGPDPSACEPCPGDDKVLCEGDGYYLTNGCVPDNMTQCEAPGPLSGAC